MRIATCALLLAATVLACTAPELEGTTFSCRTDDDCLAGNVCAEIRQQAVCTRAADTPIHVGMSAPLQGPSQDLGVEMRRGISALFENINRQGGVRGRPLRLHAMNDSYDPAAALANTKHLLDIQTEVADPDRPDIRGPNGVLALLGNVGTPTMLVTAPVANKNQVVFFAPFTGSQKYLRDGTNSPYVFNYRAGYYQEAEAMVDYMATYRTPRIIEGPESYRHLLAFTQNDSFGDAGYNGLVTAYNRRIGPVPQPDSYAPAPSIVRVTYERENVASVDPAIAGTQQFLTNLLAGTAPRISVGVLMVDTYQPGNRYIRAVKDWINADARRAGRLDVLFIHVSFVGPDALARALVSAPDTYLDVTDPAGRRRLSYADGVMVTQVVPYYHGQSAGITEYRTDMARLDGGSLSFTSLEGYIAARLFVEALKMTPSPINSANLAHALVTRIANLDIGIGTLLSFSPASRQASHTVWGSRLAADGSFTVPFIWDPVNRIVPGL
jgi:ABC-type branched-subunit amino acid transport system substrate-binding protein